MNAGEPLPDTRPVTLAAAFLHQRELAKVKWIMSQNGTEVPDEITPINLRHWREEFYRFHGCVYRRWLREEMESELLKFLNRQQAFNAKFNKLQPLRVGASTINDTMRQLRGLCQAKCEQMPTWLDGENRPDPRNVIAFTNGIMDAHEWAGDPTTPLEKPTPDWFSESVMACAYDAAATCPRWMQFLHEAIGDPELVALVQEWFGYCLTSDTSQQKMLWLHGSSGAGKSTLGRVLQYMVGKRNSVSFSLYDLMQPFTLSSFLGKTLAVSGDAMLNNNDGHRIIEQIKAISGEDDRLVNRKNRDALENIKLHVRFVIIVNEFPTLPDDADSLRRRCLIVPFENSFEGAEDYHLTDKLLLEIPGIVNWAMEGLHRLRVNERFTAAVASEQMQEEFAETNSHVRAFVNECCLLHPLKGARPKILKKDLFEAYVAWASEQKIKHPKPYIGFCKSLMQIKGVRRVKPGPNDGSKRQPHVEGLELLPAWQPEVPV